MGTQHLALGRAPLTEQQATSRVAVFKALADPARLRLFDAIAREPDAVCVCDLPDVGVSQPTVSHHLRRLRDAGLVECERRGTWVFYRLTPEGRAAATLLD